jgi:hypothetical protein
MSKESTLSDAIDLIKKLQNQVLELQRQLADSPGEAWEKQGSASCSESFTATENMPYQVIASCCYRKHASFLGNIKHSGSISVHLWNRNSGLLPPHFRIYMVWLISS